MWNDVIRLVNLDGKFSNNKIKDDTLNKATETTKTDIQLAKKDIENNNKICTFTKRQLKNARKRRLSMKDRGSDEEYIRHITDGLIHNKQLKEIGIMIEKLYNYDCDISIESSGKQWYVSVAGHINVEADNLYDALRLAIKEIN